MSPNCESRGLLVTPVPETANGIRGQTELFRHALADLANRLIAPMGHRLLQSRDLVVAPPSRGRHLAVLIVIVIGPPDRDQRNREFPSDGAVAQALRVAELGKCFAGEFALGE